MRLHFPRLRGNQLQSYIIRCIIDRQVQDVITTSSQLLTAARVCTVDDVRKQKKPLIRYSKELLDGNRKLRRFLYRHLYYHPEVAGVNTRCCELLREVFECYLGRPDLLGVATAKRLRHDGLHRAVCDYLAGMTDRYLLDAHARLLGSAGSPKKRIPPPRRAPRKSSGARSQLKYPFSPRHSFASASGFITSESVPIPRHSRIAQTT